MRQQKRLLEAGTVFANLFCWRCVEIDDRSLQLNGKASWAHGDPGAFGGCWYRPRSLMDQLPRLKFRDH